MKLFHQFLYIQMSKNQTKTHGLNDAERNCKTTRKTQNIENCCGDATAISEMYEWSIHCCVYMVVTINTDNEDNYYKLNIIKIELYCNIYDYGCNSVLQPVFMEFHFCNCAVCISKKEVATHFMPLKFLRFTFATPVVTKIKCQQSCKLKEFQLCVATHLEPHFRNSILVTLSSIVNNSIFANLLN